MKHQPQLLRGSEVIEKIENHTGEPWRHVLSVQNDVTTDDVANFWFVVRWPEHVVYPQFNFDASYSSYKTRKEAEEDIIDGFPDSQQMSDLRYELRHPTLGQVALYQTRKQAEAARDMILRHRRWQDGHDYMIIDLSYEEHPEEE